MENAKSQSETTRATRRNEETTRAIRQAVTLPAPPELFYEMYMDSKKHAAARGAPAKINRKVSGRFTAFGGMLEGRNLLIVPNRMIVQAWRAKGWSAKELDSILFLRFSKAPGGGRIDLVHAGVPSYDLRGAREGWPKYYWKPWRAYLTERRGKAREHEK